MDWDKLREEAEKRPPMRIYKDPLKTPAENEKLEDKRALEDYVDGAAPAEKPGIGKKINDALSPNPFYGDLSDVRKKYFEKVGKK
jgi:hypothetical protein